jgi:hypothetical protein
LLLALLLVLAAVPSAHANHSTTALVSQGPTGGNGLYDVCPIQPCGFAISRDGSRSFFETMESLVSADTDFTLDVYERSGNTTTLISTGPSGGNANFTAQLLDASEDGSRVFFWTQEPLTSADTDDQFDIYERSGGTTTLISTAAGGGNGPYAAVFAGATPDGTHVFFRTAESLVGADTDGEWDLYDRSSGSTTLVSTASSGGNGRYPADFAGTSDNGAHVFFKTREPMTAGDSDNCSGKGCLDIYERFGGTTSLVSTGPAGGNGAQDATFAGVSADGTRVFWTTKEVLVSGDLDALNDIYERSGGTTTLVSTGPTDQHAYSADAPIEISGDGNHVFWFTHEPLVPEDTGYYDVYERSFGTTKLVSTGPVGGNGPYHVYPGELQISKDGTHAFFQTSEKLTANDTDSTRDIYDRSGGTTALVSTGPSSATGGSPFIKGASDDGSRVFFETGEKLVPTDTDTQTDIYERFNGTTTLISTGPADDGTATGSYVAASADGAHVVFKTRDALVAGDTDACPDPSLGPGCYDFYDVSVAYQTPQSATQLSVSLVPTFLQCGTGSNPANGQHSPPLAQRACLPAKPGSNVAIFGPQAIGTGVLTVAPGNPDTSADEADVSIAANLTDIQNKTGGGDYNPNPSGPDLTLSARLRLTDTANCSGSTCSGPYQRNAATTTDLDFPVAVDCSATPDPSVGSTCAVTTSADAVQPGAIGETRQTVAQAFRLRLNDSGVNTIRGDSDDRIFSTQGIYVP